MICAHCKKKRATCIGRYDNMTEEEPACDDYCGRACEDGKCEPLSERSVNVTFVFLIEYEKDGEWLPAAATMSKSLHAGLSTAENAAALMAKVLPSTKYRIIAVAREGVASPMVEINSAYGYDAAIGIESLYPAELSKLN